MAKVKAKLTKEERQKKYMWVFMNGRQVRVKKPPTVEGMGVEEFIYHNADPMWLHQNEMWDFFQTEELF